MTVKSKALIHAYYGNASRRSYFSGCSNGGRQGLMEAQRFPADFDGIIAGAPAADWVGLNSGSLYTSLLNLPKGKAPVITPVQAALIHQAVIARCDALDGLRDGAVDDPRVCNFKAQSLVCRSGQAAGECLTQEQADVADKMYQAVREPKSGRLVLPGSLPGSEPGWGQIPVPMPPSANGGQPPAPPPAAAVMPQAARPICAYPEMARYNGSGAADAAGSFSCKPAPRGVRDGNGLVTLKPGI